jgi:5-methylcytosine-specific restriction enzyme subunit McrC
VTLAAEDARLLAASGVLDVRPGRAPGVWEVRARTRVGAARIGGVELHIAPKVPLSRLLFLVGYARNPTGWRAETVPMTDHAGLVPALAAALWRQTDRALRAGLLQGYRTVEETSPVLRGRLRETAQLGRRAGLSLPLEVSHDDYTVDIPDNQILATAVDRMLRVPGVDPTSRRMLRHLAVRFVGVTRLRPGTAPPARLPDRRGARLRVALRLAELVLAGASVEARAGGVLSNGFLLDMWRLFEDFLTVALRAAIGSTRGGVVSGQDHVHLDEAHRIRLRPDLVWRRPDGTVGAVVDVKYKLDRDNGDVYQMIAYCLAHRLPRGHLVYPVGQRTRHVIRHSGIEIVRHGLDIAAPVDDLLAQVGHLAVEITEPATASAPSAR